MEIFFRVTGLLWGKPPVTSGFTYQKPVMRRFGVFFYLICAWTNGWANYRNAGNLRHHRAHYDVSVVISLLDELSKSSFFLPYHIYSCLHDDPMILKSFQHYWSFVRGTTCHWWIPRAQVPILQLVSCRYPRPAHCWGNIKICWHLISFFEYYMEQVVIIPKDNTDNPKSSHGSWMPDLNNDNGNSTSC